MKAPEFPRVTLPGVEAEEVEALQEAMSWGEYTRSQFIVALFKKGYTFTGKAKPAPKPTKHQRRICSARERSAYLKSVG